VQEIIKEGAGKREMEKVQLALARGLENSLSLHFRSARLGPAAAM
jgi:hypothetical protein